jgi:hypothetical protein
MKDSLLVCLVKCAALMVIVGLLSFGSGQMAFTAGAESNCTQDTEPGTKCNGDGGHTCDDGVKKCKSGTALSQCKNGDGDEFDCHNEGGIWCADGKLKQPSTNSSGC